MKFPMLTYSVSLGGFSSVLDGLSGLQAWNGTLSELLGDLAVPILTICAATILVSATLLACVLALGPPAPDSSRETMRGRERICFDVTWTFLPLAIVFLFAIGARTGRS
ncbi:hypothetical protein [Paludibaculum fermentans]|uniref:hypothetical protein n=1 Tax=Paludibaculum fermentans TaxID=1473598 RepID=UPI003EB7C36D